MCKDLEERDFIIFKFFKDLYGYNVVNKNEWLEMGLMIQAGPCRPE